MEFVLKHKDGTNLNLNSRARCTAVTSAKQSKTLLSADTITVEVTAAAPLDLRIGDTLLAFGSTYTLNRLPACKKGGADVYKYTIELEGLQYALIDRVFMLPDGTVGDDFFSDLRGAMKILLANANRDNSGKPYQLGGSPAETDYRNVNYAGSNCLRALQQICEDWEVEFKMRETEAAIIVDLDTFTTTFPVAFRVGRRGGMYELTRNRPTDDLVTRLFAFGGTENLAYYRHTRLCLPGAGRKESYIEDEAVSSVYGVKEGVYNFDDIYPKRTGSVTALGSDYKTFVDSTIDFDLNEKWANTDAACIEWLALKGIEDTADNRNVYFNDVAGKSTRWLMAGQTAQIHFQTGALAGYDIDIEGYDHATHTLKLIPLKDANGYEFPSGTSGAFRVAVGDEYIFLGINLPDSYKTAAEQKLLTAAQERYETMCRPRASYTLTLSPLWLQRVAGQGATGYNVFEVGDTVHVVDDALGLDTYIRVQAFERDCINPYDYKLTIADDCTVQTAAKVMSEVKRLTAVVEAAGVADPNRKRRAWLTAQEVLNKTFDTEGHYYSEKIAPLSIETSMLAVGARSQQLALSNVIFTPNAYNGTTADPSKLTATAGALLHYSIDPDGVKVWQMAALNVTGLASGALYVYAKCQRAGTGGVFIVDAVQRVFDADPSFYFFLIGTLSSVDKETNTRVLSLTYGSTTINGRYVKTGRISSNDGKTYFDLDTGIINGKITFTNSAGGSEDLTDALSGIQNTADAAKNAANNIKVGGRNYLYDTAKARAVTGGGSSASSILTNYLYYGDTSGEAWTAGTVVTFSCDYDATAMTGGTCPLLVHLTWWLLQKIQPGTSGHISVTMTLSKSITTPYKVYVQGKWDGDVVITNAKWEVGNKATSWTEAPEDVNARISAAQSTATNAASSATSALNTASAAQSTATNAASSATSALNTASAAQSTANAAQSTANDANSKIDGLQLGGTNLHPFTGGGNWVKDMSTNTVMDGDTLIVSGASYNYTRGAEVTLGETYTISFDVKGEVSAEANCFLLIEYRTDSYNRLYWPSSEFTITAEWRRVSITHTMDTSYTGTKYLCLSLRIPGSVKTYYRHVKIERGNRASDWTPAPEDVDGAISNVETAAKNAASAASAAQTTADEAARRAAAALSGNMWQDQFFEAYTYSNIYTGTTETVPVGKALIHSTRDIVIGDYVRLQPGHYYRIECTAKRTAGNLPLSAGTWTDTSEQPWHYWQMEAISDVGTGWTRMAVTFAAGSLKDWGTYTGGRLFFQILQAASGGSTTWLISNVTWQDVTAAVSNYLTESFKNNGTTDIEGGVVLTNFLGVRPLGGTFAVAGIVASDEVYNAGEIAFFAGATKAGGWNTAPFRVTYGGHVTLNDVEITSGGGMTLKDGKMTLSNGGLLSSFSNEKYTNLLDALVGQTYTLNSSPVTETDSGGVPLTLGSNISYDVTNWVSCDLSVGHSLSLPSAGTLKSTSPSFRAEYYLEYDYNVWTVRKLSLVFQLSTKRTVPGNTSASVSGTETLTVTSTTPNTWTAIKSGTFGACDGIAVSAGTLTDYRTLTLKSGTVVTTNNTGTQGTLPLLVIKVRLVKDAGTLTLTSASYTNKYFSNGMMQARDASHYFGFLCGSGNGADLLLRQGNRGFRSSLDNGLQLMSYEAPHLSGSNPGYFKMNPVSLVVRLTFNGSSSSPGYTAALLYDPYNYHGGAAPAVTRNGVGLVTFPHKMNKTTFTVLGSGVGDKQAYITIVSRTTTNVQIGISDDSSRNDYNVELVFIDYTILH